MVSARRDVAGAVDPVRPVEVAVGEPVPTQAEEAPGALRELRVRDFALIEDLRLPVEPGLTVISGETGAGKSLLIDALGLALGARADPSTVRHGADRARIEARFEGPAGRRLVVREVSAGGRSLALLDEAAVSLARLAEVVGSAVEIHGQHDQQRLLDPRRQRDLLDAFAGLGPLRAAVAEAVERWRTNRAALAALAVDPQELARRIEIAEHEAAEIAAARLRPGEAAEIRERLAAASHAEAIARGAEELGELLGGEGASLRELAGRAVAGARRLAGLDRRFEAVAERLAGVEAEVDDLAREVRRLAEPIDHDPASLARLEARLSEIHSLLRRYGDDEAAVIAYGERAAAEAARLRDADVERERRAAAEPELLADVAARAAELSARRRSAAVALAAAVDDALAELGFRRGAFSVAVGRRAAAPDEPAVEIDGDAVAFDATGVDEVVFTFAPNVGEPARPLARIGSGGELSRVALAIEEVLAGVDATPTLVFDEIDAGIGGRSAEPVGRALWRLARRHDVLCVTHLAQIAAYADHHLQIAKASRGGRTVTELRVLDRAGRVDELAAMLGGRDGGPAALASAAELLERADRWRRAEAEAGRGTAEPVADEPER
ncbi:MAG: DNA repair protein RecN [Chloroflexota bacterium]|nr:MAG: DNA repair protein RecN [Chloroflexota bacterium]